MLGEVSIKKLTKNTLPALKVLAKLTAFSDVTVIMRKSFNEFPLSVSGKQNYKIKINNRVIRCTLIVFP